jgi:hypothetical protein
MDAFSDNLARTIILDVLEDIKTTKRQNPELNSRNSTGNVAECSSGSSSGNTPKRKRKTGSNSSGTTGNGSNGKNETDIDILANRLTSDIITHATYSDPKLKKDKIKQSKVESSIPASEYQQAVINYQNQNGFEVSEESQLPVRRSSIWNKQPNANSIWNMTDD